MASAKNIHDVLIIGAGVSGIGLATSLKSECPDKKVLILEQRQAVGGTWDLFNYPGVRSDSDMFTFSYDFKPWTKSQVLADGASIKTYVTETAQQYDIYKEISFSRKVLRANWCAKKGLWEVEAVHLETDKAEQYSTRFLFFCTGYYRYEEGYRPIFKGEDTFHGDIIHAQLWPKDFDYSGKKVVVVGSGATAITLVPNMVDKAAKVTMLQRSPTYIMSIPASDKIAEQFQKILPEKLAYRLNRNRNIIFQRKLYQICQKYPKLMRSFLLKQARFQLGGKVDMRHFTPHYLPWEQRLCFVPNGDLFKAIRSGKADIVTDHIDSFNRGGIRLKSGKFIEADLVVLATGLKIQMLGGMILTIDGKDVQVSDQMLYKGTLIESVPNAALMFGYINSSWTLKVNLAAQYFCRLLKYMDKNDKQIFTPIDSGSNQEERSFVDNLAAGYIQREAHNIPRQGKTGNWRVWHDYFKDLSLLTKEPVEDNELLFSAIPIKFISNRKKQKPVLGEHSDQNNLMQFKG
jgi:monooxygenase